MPTTTQTNGETVTGTRQTGFARLFVGASLSSLAFATMMAAPANAQVVITDDTPVSNPGGQPVTSAAGVTQTVNSGDNIELEDDSNDGTVITLAGTHINNDTSDEDVVIFVDNSEDDVVINIESTGILQGVNGVIFYEGDGMVLTNNGRIEGIGNEDAEEGVVYIDRDTDGTLNTITNNGVITGVGGPTIGAHTYTGATTVSGGSSTISTLGLRFAASETAPLTLRGKAGWQHAFGNLSPISTASFDTGAAFNVIGAPQSRDAAFAQMEGVFRISENSTLSVSYDGLFGGKSLDHAIMGGVSIGF